MIDDKNKRKFSCKVFIDNVVIIKDLLEKSRGETPTTVKLSPKLYSMFEQVPTEVEGIKVVVSAYLLRDDCLYFGFQNYLIPKLTIKD